MKLSNILNDLSLNGFYKDHKITELLVNIPFFSVYYVCELGGLLFKHDSMGVIYTEVLEPSESLSASDIEKIEHCLNAREMCHDCQEKSSIDCHVPTC
jgi:hypothetical protein